MIDSGCFGHVCPPWFAPQFPMVSSTNVDAVAANKRGTATLRNKKWCVVRARDEEQWKTNFDPCRIWRDERAQTSLEHFCTNIVA